MSSFYLIWYCSLWGTGKINVCILVHLEHESEHNIVSFHFFSHFFFSDALTDFFRFPGMDACNLNEGYMQFELSSIERRESSLLNTSTAEVSWIVTL